MQKSFSTAQIAHGDHQTGKFQATARVDLAALRDAYSVPSYAVGGYQRELQERKVRGVHECLYKGGPLYHEVILAYMGPLATFDSRSKRLTLDLGGLRGHDGLDCVDGQHRCAAAWRMLDGADGEEGNPPIGKWSYLTRECLAPAKKVWANVRFLVGYSEKDCAEVFRETNGNMTRVTQNALFQAQRYEWTDSVREHQDLYDKWKNGGPLDGIARTPGSRGITPIHWKKYGGGLLRNPGMGADRKEVLATTAVCVIAAHGVLLEQLASPSVFAAFCDVLPQVVAAWRATGKRRVLSLLVAEKLEGFNVQDLDVRSRESIKEAFIKRLF